MTVPFIDQTDLSDYLGRDVTSDNGALAAVDAACEIVRAIADQRFDMVVGETVALDGTGTDCLLLPELPVVAAGTVTLAGVPLVQGVDYAVGDGGKLLRMGGTSFTTYLPYAGETEYSGYGGFYGMPSFSYPEMPALFMGLGGGRWPPGRQNIVVTYDHGYLTVPSSVRRVALGLATRLLIQGEAISESVAGGANVNYKGPPMDLSMGERLVLERYRAR